MARDSYLLVDEIEVNRIGWRQSDVADAVLLGEAERRLKDGALCAEYYGILGPMSDVLRAKIVRTPEGKLSVVAGNQKDEIFVCNICGQLIRSSHLCVRGKECHERYIEGTTFSGCRPNDHPCAAFFHAQGKIISIDNPDRLPVNISEWEMIQERKTHGAGHHYYYFAKRGVNTDELADFLRENPAFSNSEVIVEGEQITVRSSNLGFWIGSGGRWAKAYRRLGLNVRFLNK